MADPNAQVPVDQNGNPIQPPPAPNVAPPPATGPGTPASALPTSAPANIGDGRSLPPPAPNPANGASASPPSPSAPSGSAPSPPQVTALPDKITLPTDNQSALPGVKSPAATDAVTGPASAAVASDPTKQAAVDPTGKSQTAFDAATGAAPTSSGDYVQAADANGNVKWYAKSDVTPRNIADQMMMTAHIYSAYDPVAGAELYKKAQEFASGDIDLKAKQYSQQVLDAAKGGDPQAVIQAMNAHNPSLGNYDLQDDGKGGYTVTHYVDTQKGHIATGEPVDIKPDVAPDGRVIQTAYQKLVANALSYASPQGFKDHAEAGFSQTKDEFDMLLKQEQAKQSDAAANNLNTDANYRRIMTPIDAAKGLIGNTADVAKVQNDYGVTIGGGSGAAIGGTTPATNSGAVFHSHDAASYLQGQGLNFTVKSFGRTPEENTAATGVPNSAHLYANGDRAIDIKPQNGQSLSQLAGAVQAKMPGAKVLVENVGAKNSTGPHVHVQWDPSYTPPNTGSTMQSSAIPGTLPATGSAWAQGGAPNYTPADYKTMTGKIDSDTSEVYARTLANANLQGPPPGVDIKSWNPQSYAQQVAKAYHDRAFQSLPQSIQEHYLRDQGVPTTPTAGQGGVGAPSTNAAPSAPATPYPAAPAKPSPTAVPMPQSSDQQFVSSVGSAIDNAVHAGQQKHEAAMNQIWVAHYQQPYEMFHQQYVAARQTGKAPDMSVIQALAPALSDTSFRNKIPPEELKYLQQAAR